MIIRLVTLGAITALISVAQTKGSASTSMRFEDYAITQIYSGPAAEPILRTAAEKHFQTRIRKGVSEGAGVWTGSWKSPVNQKGPNYAGHYFVIRWGCGSNCLMMAIVDAQRGKVYGPPLNRGGTELYLPMDPMSDVEIDFRADSSLMVLRNACKTPRSECGVYYFNWKNNQFALVKRVLVNLADRELPHP
jgi:hypothetical protein